MKPVLGADRWRGVSAWVESLTGTDAGVLGPLLDTLVIALFYLLMRRLLAKALTRNVEEAARRYTINKIVGYSLGIVALLLLFQIWISDTVDLSTYLGILSAGLAIALKDPILNLAGWLHIMARQPFKVGDRIEIGGVAGDVVDVGPLTFSMLEIGNWVQADQSTGRIVHLPNGLVFQGPVASYTHGFEYIWNELMVTVTFESDWRRAKVLLDEIASRRCAEVISDADKQLKRTSNKYMVTYKHLTPIVWVSVADMGVQLDVRYLCPARARRSTASAIWVDMLDAFDAEERVDFAYPTRRVYNHNTEGKPALRAAEPPAPGPAP